MNQDLVGGFNDAVVFHRQKPDVDDDDDDDEDDDDDDDNDDDKYNDYDDLKLMDDVFKELIGVFSLKDQHQ